MQDAYTIRRARTTELAALSEIEDDAGAMYGEVDIDPDLPGLTRDELGDGQRDGLLWVIVDGDDVPVAFALCQAKPGALHLRELDVAPAHMRRGLGRRLIEHVRRQALDLGLPQVTLTTFADVPWNAALYRRYGFVELAPATQPDWLRQIRAHEDAGILASWPRIAMAIDAAG